MNTRSKMCSAVIVGLAMAASAYAQAPANVQMEVNFLLGYVDGSGCVFYRNGSAYDSKAAQAHLRDKYKYLEAESLIHSAEDFIEKAATVSSFSGEPYLVQCNGGTPVTSNEWLRDELARLRKTKN
jgi:hypothetical protein